MDRNAEENPQARSEFEMAQAELIKRLSEVIQTQPAEQQIQAICKIQMELNRMQAEIVQQLINEGDGRLTEICKRAEFIFKDNAASWLWTPSCALGGQTPIGLLFTKEGIERVLNVLGRIEYGVLS